MADSTVSIRLMVRGVEEFGRAMRRTRLKIRWLGFVLYRHRRPDGRPRRSGHRHRGTDAWANRYRTRTAR